MALSGTAAPVNGAKVQYQLQSIDKSGSVSGRISKKKNIFFNPEINPFSPYDVHGWHLCEMPYNYSTVAGAEPISLADS